MLFHSSNTNTHSNSIVGNSLYSSKEHSSSIVDYSPSSTEAYTQR